LFLDESLVHGRVNRPPVIPPSIPPLAGGGWRGVALLPYCDRLIALDPQPLYRDSRGLAYALAGDYPAAMADFQAFIDWLASQPDPTAQTTLAQRQRWVEALQAGENPLTPAVLDELR